MRNKVVARWWFLNVDLVKNFGGHFCYILVLAKDVQQFLEDKDMVILEILVI